MNQRGCNLFFFNYREETFLLDTNTRLFWTIDIDNELESEIIEQSHSIFDILALEDIFNSPKNRLFFSKLKILHKRGFFEYSFEKNLNKNNSIDYIVINPSNGCNSECWYCYSRSLRDSTDKQLSQVKVKEIIDYFADQKQTRCDNKPLGISLFYTGDITLNFEFFKSIVSYTNSIQESYNFDLLVFLPPTNFLNPSDEFIDYINRYGHISISVDLSNEEKIEKVLNNISKLETNIIKQVLIPVHSKIKNLFSIYARFMKYFDHVSMRPIRTGGVSLIPWDSTNLSLFLQEIDFFILKLLKLDESMLIPFFSKLGQTDYFKRYFNRVVFREKHLMRCPAGSTAIAIDNKADLYPCSGLIDFPDYKMNIKSLFSDIEQRNFVRNVDNISDCRKCEIRYYCGGPCIDWFEKQNEQTHSSVNVVECKINKKLVKGIIFLVSELKQKYPKFFELYAEKEKRKNRMNYFIELDAFFSFFDFM